MDDFRALGARLSNWGRWGDDDERGTVNLITPNASQPRPSWCGVVPSSTSAFRSTEPALSPAAVGSTPFG